MIGLYWKVIGWMILVTIVLTIWISAVLGIAYVLSDFNDPVAQKLAFVSQQLPVLIGYGVGYVAILLVISMLMRIYLIHDVWKRVAESVTVHNVVAAHNVTTQGSPVGALGEGFAGSLDVVGF
jgi:tetrahydromethanopterin S-methyltransferase subunit E